MQVWDSCRKSYVTLTPEEYVRQSFISFLVNTLGYPAGRTSVERILMVNGQRQRADIVVFSKDMSPFMVVECKAPSVSISQKTLDQALRYNTQLGVHYLVLTNGLTHYCVDMQAEKPKMVSTFPNCS
ncbi:MAG: type I restriction enzyme HsdR N-terminal domain-containing protein [Marinilabiliaceae bacterium]|nr:type I restriction enzyme HsdR N-terminal domain-containing protein [Marinilabiliaceae bacterium]